MRGDRYVGPTTVEDALATLAIVEQSAVRVVGGGTWVVPALDSSRAPVTLLSLRRLPLRGLELRESYLLVGPMTTYDDLLSDSAAISGAGLLRRAAGEITGGRQIRARGTIGGSLVAARPQSDVPGVLATCGATVRVASVRGERHLPMNEFLIGAGCTSLAADEIVTSIRIPVDAESGTGYVKIKATTSSWPIVTAAAKVWLHDDGTIRRAVAGLSGAAATPRTADVTEVVGGTQGAREVLLDAAETLAVRREDAWDDELAPATYRAAMSTVAVRRALERAVSNAYESGE